MSLTENYTEQFYDQDAEKYDRRWATPGGAITARAQEQIVLNLTEGWRNKHILEVGCGTGRFSLPLSAITNRYSIVDLSSEMLAITQKKLSVDKELRLEARNASVYELPFTESSFDCAISINVFNHLDDIGRALREVSRVLTPHGKLLVNFANTQSFFALPAWFINRMKHSVSSDVYSVWLPRKRMFAYMEETGFNILRVVGNVYVPFYLDYPVIRDVLAKLDTMSRTSRFKVWAPSLFFLCEKRGN